MSLKKCVKYVNEANVPKLGNYILKNNYSLCHI